MVKTTQDKSPTIVVKCACSSKYQDNKYGKGNRIANRRHETKHKREARCTVCGSVKSV